MHKIITVLLFCLCLVDVQAQGTPTEAEDRGSPPETPLAERPSVALVLGGGGARGFAHIAVLEIIDELGIPVDMVAGVSSGAIVGGLYAAGHSPAMILEAFTNSDWSSFFQDRPVSPFWNRSEGFPLAISLGVSGGTIGPDWGKGYSSGQTVYGLFKSLTAKIPSHLDFDKLPIPFRAGAVEVPSGKFELLSKGDLAEAIRASMSIQGVFQPFDIDGHSYADGGLLNNLPIREVRELGYDIIIAVDLFAAPEKFDTAPAELPNLITTLYMNRVSNDDHVYADVVLFPLLTEMSMLDFSNGHEMYMLARGEREKLAALLEPIREKTVNSRINRHKDYRDMPPLTPQKMIVTGAMPRDRSFIEKLFSRHIMGKALDEKNVPAFLERIYETGNYRMATIRTDLHGGETCLELTLYPETQNHFLLRAALDFEGTFSSHSFDKTALRSGFEFRAKKGYSLLLEASIMDELSVGLSMFQPLGPHFFLSAEADLVRDQELKVKGIMDTEKIIPDRLLYFKGILKGGLRFNRYNSLTIWPEYFWFRQEYGDHTMAGAAAAYTYSSLDHPLFPFRGFWGRIENHLRFTLNTPEPFDLLSLDLTAAIPLGSHFSLGLSGFASSLFGEPDLSFLFSTFEVEKTERIFFPHASGIFSGERRAALSLALRFEPMESLTILGGKLIFSLAAAVGRAGSFEWNEWENFGKDDLIWNASIGVGLVPLKYFGFRIRTGAGGGGGYQPAPFISLDVGMSGFQKRLF